MADKTQVFPLDTHDSVRTRLTHSHEVANLARGMGTSLALTKQFKHRDNILRELPSLLATIGLAHDLGNPPFGHQGEAAIRLWFVKQKPHLFDGGHDLSDAMKLDFLNFDGNAQTLRLVTRLQSTNDAFGLNLTTATLAALLKYPVGAAETSKRPTQKKPGFFESERHVVEDVWKQTGLSRGIRHPLTFLMEACDDIAYSILDAEDAAKKAVVSFPDLASFLRDGEHDSIINEMVEAAEADLKEFRKHGGSPSEINTLTMQKFRGYALAAMRRSAMETFEDKIDRIMQGTFNSDLMSNGSAAALCERLKGFVHEHAHKNRSVLAIELKGFTTIQRLMGYLWRGISEREQDDKPDSKRTSPFASYAYARVSENYKLVFEQPTEDDRRMPLRYRELRLLTDMVAGMTDTYALDLCEELRALDEV